jgi:hypothetical protein
MKACCSEWLTQRRASFPGKGPKYLAKFSMDFRPGSVRATLAGEFTVTHSPGFGFSARGVPFVTYTIKDRHLIRTFTPVDHRVRYGGSKTVRIEMHGNGPAAQVVQSLGLGSLQPVFTFRTDSLRAVLPQGQDRGAIP